jgi:hypothetical protein
VSLRLDPKQAVLLLLRRAGPLSRPELTALLPVSATTVQNAIAELHTEQRIHIAGWKRAIGTKGRLAPRFAVGWGTEVPKPPVDRNAEARRYLAKNRLVISLRRAAYRARKRGVVPVNMWLSLLQAKTK